MNDASVANDQAIEPEKPVGEDPDEFGPIVLPPAKRHTRKKPSALRSLVEWVVVIVGSLAVALLIQSFLLQPFKIPSGSMIPTLHVHDRIVVNKLSYKVHDVHRGDVVVFTRPRCDGPTSPTWANCVPLENLEDLVKRVVGLPGNKLYIANDKVYVDGEPLAEPYVRAGAPILPQPTAGCGFPGTEAKPYVVPAKTVFVMGDNRDNSIDSRCFGPIKQSTIVGRAFVRIWPPSRIGGL